MVAGALYVRNRQDGGGGGILPGGEAPVAIVCAPELAAACEALAAAGVEVSEQDAAATADALLSDAPPDVDAWLVPSPWPQIVNDELVRRGGAPALEEPGPALARSPAVIAIWQDRAAVLRRACNGTVGWTCIGQAARGTWADVGGQKAWGPVKPSHDDPRRGVGVAVLGAMTANHLGRPKFNAQDLRGDAFLNWFSPLEEATKSFGSAGSPPFREMVSFGASRFDAVGTVEALAARLLATSPRADTIEIIYTEPVVTADVLLAPLRGRDNKERAVEVVAEVAPAALAETGWRVEDLPAIPGVDAGRALPKVSDGPSAGALDALRRAWEEER